MRRVGFLWLLFIMMAQLWPLPALAADVTLPEEFYGEVTINNLSAPAGTTIVANIDSAERGRLVTTESGKYGGAGTFTPRLVVAGVQGEVGKTITFSVNGVQANQTAIYEPGQSKQLNLAAQAYPLGAGDIQITKSLSYLRQAQQSDGSIGGFVTSAWVVIAITAAGQDPNSWTAGGKSVVGYLSESASANLDQNKATDWERSILAIVAAGENPRDFGGINYVAKLLSLYQNNQMGDVTMLNDDFWGILALNSIGESPQIVQNMRSFIISKQNSDGGWGWTVGGNSDADNTAVAISALVAAGESPASQAAVKALAYLKSQQQNDGGFASEGATNTGVDSWAINALASIGQSPLADGWRKSGNNPIGHLLSLQDADGAFKWSAAQRSNPQWMTAYAIPALLGKSSPRDGAPPTISNLTPASGTTVTAASVVIGASYADKTAGINQTTARIQLDGTDVTASATVSTSGISYAATTLAQGSHTARVTVSDKVGNQSSQSWSFQVTASTLGGGGGTPLTPTPDTGTIDISQVVRGDGVFIQGVTAQSPDSKCTLSINIGTKGLTASGQSLSQVSVAPMVSPPPAPAQSSVIGLVYDLGPDGATFDPPITLTFSYSDSLVPQGVDEKKLVIAVSDIAAGKWVELTSTVDPLTNAVSARVSHFSAYTVIAHTRPASFVLANLSISPAEVKEKEAVNISIQIANDGDLSGSYDVVLKVDNAVAQTKNVTLAGSENQTVSFSVSKDAAGTYAVSIGSLGGSFRVGAAQQLPANFSIRSLTADPSEVKVGESVSIAALVANSGDLAGTYRVVLKINNVTVATREVALAGGASERITFTVTRDTPGTYTASVDNLSVSLVVNEAPPVASPSSPVPPPSPIKPTNWLIIGGIIVMVIVVVLLILFTIRRTIS
ncbi:MAG: hypothetical protein HY663_00345 [Chloroflexi bacterium]|nr:hypothetical protein [Chloroflexota bacterium]